MIGLLYLLFFWLYLWLSIKAVKLAARWAGAHGRSPRLWGFLAGLAMYSLVFWDLIPTYALHGYYCATQAGFTQYETLEQWKQENPGVAKTLKPIKNPPWRWMTEPKHILLNQRFTWETLTKWHPFHIRERDERIVDVKTGDVLARYVDFDTDIRALGLGPRYLRDYKPWLMRRSCERGQRMWQKEKFNDFSTVIENLGGRK